MLPHMPINGTFVEGIPVQQVADAILSCRKSIMTDRLVAATRDARTGGYITKAEYMNIMRELADGEETE